MAKLRILSQQKLLSSTATTSDCCWLCSFCLFMRFCHFYFTDWKRTFDEFFQGSAKFFSKDLNNAHVTLYRSQPSKLAVAYQQHSHLKRDDVPNKYQSLYWNLTLTWIPQVKNIISFKLFQLYQKYKNNVLLIQKNRKAGWALPCTTAWFIPNSTQQLQRNRRVSK